MGLPRKTEREGRNPEVPCIVSFCRLCLTPELLRIMRHCSYLPLNEVLQYLQAEVAAALVAASILALGTQRLVFLDGTLLEMLQIPCLEAFPDPFSLGWALGAGKGKQRERGGRRGGSPTPSSGKLGLIQCHVEMVVLSQCLCSDGKLTNNKSEQCFQAV